MANKETFGQVLWRWVRSPFSGRRDSPLKTLAPLSRRRISRRFDAAKLSRLNYDWTTESRSAKVDLRLDLRTLRARSRDLVRNNPHLRKFVNVSAPNNVVGSGEYGIKLQVNLLNSRKQANRKLADKIEAAFWDWSLPETCSVSGRLSFLDAQRLALIHVLRDGECLVQKVRADNKFGFSLKFIDAAYLDETYNETLSDGRRIIMSVELDANSKPIAYWLTPPVSEALVRGERERQRRRVPAEEIIHVYLPTEDEDQIRGVPYLCASALSARNLGQYDESVLASAWASAATFGMLMEQPSEENVFEGLEDDEGNKIVPEIDVNPLSMNIVPPGYQFNQFDPKQPTQNHETFKKTILADVAAGVGQNYFSFAGDMSAVNFASGRLGLNEDRDLWKYLQMFMATHFCRQVFNAWIDLAYLRGVVNFPITQMEQVKNPKWHGRGWAFYDPPKDISSASEGLKNGMIAWSDHLAERGIDYVEHLQKLKSDELLAKEILGRPLEIADTPKPGPVTEDEPEETDDEE